MDDVIKEYGMTTLNSIREGHFIKLISIIGEIEGHESAPEKMKTTKYEHILPILAKLQDEQEVDGILFLINTVGGDVSCGLALAEFIASISKPTAAFVIGDSHSIGVPLSVAADYTVIAPSATVIIHPVRMNGPVLGAPQTYEYFNLIQERITQFIASHADVKKEQVKEWMVRPGILSRDLGTIFVGQEAVDAGLYQKAGGLCDALEKLRAMIGDEL
ncbi:MAG: ATP-dependent Clp protease proteolytic subunit [Butyribacter sp.]|nr:ATP-dependent Clp protease proteolytic subunit [bacterium]MDY3853848.1 ATP-dependent Clp protease proteolytic subunit [Butyribacter sp.]